MAGFHVAIDSLSEIDLEMANQSGSRIRAQDDVPHLDTLVRLRRRSMVKQVARQKLGTIEVHVREVEWHGARAFEVPAILVKRPFADAIFGEVLWGSWWPRELGRKSIEVRSYDTDVRGPLLIAASSSPAPGWRAEFQSHAIESLMSDRTRNYRVIGIVRLKEARLFRCGRDEGAAWCSSTPTSFAWEVEPVGLLEHSAWPDVCAGCLDRRKGSAEYSNHQPCTDAEGAIACIGRNRVAVAQRGMAVVTRVTAAVRSTAREPKRRVARDARASAPSQDTPPAIGEWMYRMARTETRRAFIPVMRELADEDLIAFALRCSVAEAAELLARTPLETLSRSHSSRESDARLLACVEVGRRARYRAAGKRRPLRKSPDVKRAFRRLQDAIDEEFRCVYLDAQSVPLEERLIARGAPNEVSVDLRAVVAHALRIGAVSIIVVHNHPSGDPTPSKPDIDLTISLCRACETVDLRLIDHVIVARRRHHSFLDANQLGGVSSRRSRE